jgi:hypothetical protein
MPRVKDFSGAVFRVETVEPRVLLAGSPLGSLPALNSFPGAVATLYVDLHGENAQNWGMASVPATPAYDIDGDPTTFSTQELANIQQIWSRVAEAYSPFNVNVTTVDPGNWNLNGAGLNFNQFRVVVGGTGSWTGITQGGTASVGSYYTPGLPNTSYVFSTQLGGDPQFTGDEVGHEAGHGFGLQHQSLYSGMVETSEYNPGNALTAPFMGNPLRTGVRATWWYGPSSQGYNIIQDDVSILSGSAAGFGYRTLQTGQSAALATAMSVSGNVLSGEGIIETTGQRDYYSFNVPVAGTATLSVNVAPFGAMLHSQLELHNASDGVIATAALAGTLGQTLTLNLPAGRYYAVVKSYGQYGDIGQYTLSGQLPGTPATVLGRYTFYNGSVFDGRNIALNAADDGAVATDKQALLPGGVGQFANFTSYSMGLNGIMVDVANLAGTPTPADFNFAAGTTANTSAWAAAPAPNGMLIRPGAGVLGSTRIEFTWANGSLTNRWLGVTMKTDAATGLASADVFYFGNLIGFAGEAPVNEVYSVTTADQLAARLDLHSFLNPALITNTHDYSRDGRVDATDEIIAGLQISASGSLLSLQTPALPAIAAVAASTINAVQPVSTDAGLNTSGSALDLSGLVDGQGVRPRRGRRHLLAPPVPVSGGLMPPAIVIAPVV